MSMDVTSSFEKTCHRAMILDYTLYSLTYTDSWYRLKIVEVRIFSSPKCLKKA